MQKRVILIVVIELRTFALATNEMKQLHSHTQSMDVRQHLVLLNIS